MDNNLIVFVNVAEQESFSRAANLLHMTPSAISLNIKSLEKKLEVKLFDRTNKYVRLTTAGEILYEHAKEILYKYTHVKHLLEDLNQSPTGPISIGAAYTFGEYFLPNILFAFHKMYPKILPDIKILNSKRVSRRIDNHELDVGFVVGDVFEEGDRVITPFSQDKMVLVVPYNHPLTQKRHLDFRQLEEETWIIREEGSGTRKVTNRLFSQLGISPNRIMSFGSSQTIKKSVALGLGISYLSEFVVKEEVSLGKLTSIELKDYPNTGKFSIMTNKTKIQSRPTNIFLDFLQSYTPPKNIFLSQGQSIIR
ncbi:LysR family transcriptional regulator [Aquibacillus albus]|uniref:DNA-binding transcriptional LysR family regulator n=1 Tax=Aquibacillus albus TaxID=1168171 RepID=A0ABS2MW85_9BACI|nr:LysR family transcriptional regulator [Aquibacillus albus]MBM7570038.1 DNA-binding transcriptional LysR family regulator [Aquibacillus albus]